MNSVVGDPAQLQKMAARFYSACLTLDKTEVRALEYNEEAFGMDDLCKEVMGILNAEKGYAPRWKVLAVIIRIGDLSSIV